MNHVKRLNAIAVLHHCRSPGTLDPSSPRRVLLGHKAIAHRLGPVVQAPSTVTLTVTDNLGKTASTSTSVTVSIESTNQPPVADYTYYRGTDEQTVDFDASASTDDGTITSWIWNFGDGTTGNGERISHTYAALTNYTVTLTVIDDLDAEGDISKTVMLPAPPRVNRSPEIVMMIPDALLAVPDLNTSLVDTLKVDLKPIFLDRDEDTLIYKNQSSSDAAVAVVGLRGDTLIVTPIAAGVTTISITADDGNGGETTDSFLVRVNNPPDVIALSDAEALVGCSPVSIPVDLYFQDPEMDPMTFDITESLDTGIATIRRISDTLIEVNCIGPGNTEILLSASDPYHEADSTSFRFGVNALPAPNVTAGEGIETTPLPVQASLSKDRVKDIERIEIHYRGGGSSDTTFAVAVMDSSATADLVTYGFDIPGDSITVRGVEYFIQTVFKEGVFAKGVASKYRSEFKSEPIFVENLANTQTLPGGEHRLISFPFNIDSPHALKVLWDDLGLPDNSKWRFFEALEGESCDPDELNFREFIQDNEFRIDFNEEDSLKTGKAYWIIVDDPHQIDAGSGFTNVINKTFAIELHKGWNLIGNPFAYDIPLGNVTFDDVDNGTPQLYEYVNRSWVPAHTLKPFTGYALCQPDAETLNVKPQLTLVPSTSSKPDWAVSISAKDRQMRDVQNVASVTKDALDEWDPSDSIEPPWLSEFVSVYFSHPNWGGPALSIPHRRPAGIYRWGYLELRGHFQHQRPGGPRI